MTNCTCCSNKDRDLNVVKDDQQIEEMKTVKILASLLARIFYVVNNFIVIKL